MHMRALHKLHLNEPTYTATYEHTSAISVNTMKYTRTAKFPVAAAKPSIRTCQLLPNNSSNRITGTQEIDTQMNRGNMFTAFVFLVGRHVMHVACEHLCACVCVSLCTDIIQNWCSPKLLKILSKLLSQ